MKIPSLNLLKKIGLVVPEKERVLYYAKNAEVILIFARAIDIPVIVERQGADVGLTGYDFVKERDAQVAIPIHDLGFGHAKIVIAGPIKKRKLSIYDIQPHHVIATPYPTITREFLNKKRIYAHVIHITGAAEIMPLIGMANFIADITTTGQTLQENKLIVLEDGEILKTSACLINNTNLFPTKERIMTTLIKKIKEALQCNSNTAASEPASV